MSTIFFSLHLNPCTNSLWTSTGSLCLSLTPFHSFMAPHNSLKMLEQCRVAPPPDSVIQASLPLSFFDLMGLVFPPIELLFFYHYPHSKTHFTDSLIPKLKHSLSLTLQHFYPLAGSLTWPPESEKPVIQYLHTDSVSLIIAESDNDFYHLSANHVRDITEFHPLIPLLPISDTVATVLALQLTVFPNSGFCIGIVMHHAVADGQTTARFMKSWASICRSGDSSLLPDCLPIYDRSLIKGTDGLEKTFLNLLYPESSKNRSLGVMVPRAPPPDTVKVKGTFELSRGDIERLRKWVLKRREEKDKQTPPLHVSAFVITCSYVWVCVVRAEEIRNKEVCFGFAVDCRARLEPPIPATYFGNCLSGCKVTVETCELMGEDGVGIAVEAFSEAIRGLERGILRGLEENFSGPPPTKSEWSTFWATRLEIYGTDFGWGRPTNVEITSIDRTRSISLAESRDGSRGVEVGLALSKLKMEVFASLFTNGLKCI